ncbi:MAG: cytochrome P450 [Betaproteobacteria bacterium]|nr:cytochrome P450 [Betaproteobacteria bacterium]
MRSEALAIPAHIPTSLVFDYDMYRAPQLGHDPQRTVSRLLQENAPDVFYSPYNGGHWIVTRAETAVDMLRQPDKFSSLPEHNKHREFKPRMLPIQSDPPEHLEYRKPLGERLSPEAVRQLEHDIRAFAREILAGLYPKGRCEFVQEVGLRFPIAIFMRLSGAPMKDVKLLVSLADKYTRSPELVDRQDAVRRLGQYLNNELRDRVACPRSDLLTLITQSKVGDRPLNDDEREGMCVLLFLAGLDTVKSVLSFIFARLAQSPEHYRRLVANPETIGTAMEELMRLSGVSQPERGVTHDFVYRGVPFRKGDRVVFITPLYGMDDRVTENPFELDFDRPMPRHWVFGAGTHRCLGSHLARLEIRVLIEEWTKAIPAMGVENNQAIEAEGRGLVWTPKALPLVWQVS